MPDFYTTTAFVIDGVPYLSKMKAVDAAEGKLADALRDKLHTAGLSARDAFKVQKIIVEERRTLAPLLELVEEVSQAAID